MPNLAKKISLLIIIILAVVIIVFWYQGGKVKEENNKAITASSTTKIVTATQKANIESLALEALKQAQINFPSTPSASSNNIAIQKDKYNLTDLNKTTNNSTTTLRTYGNNIATVLAPFSQVRENEAKIMLRIIDSRKSQDIELLKTANALFLKTEKSLAGTLVPSGAENAHLKLLNITAKLASLTSNMTKVLTNPLLALESAGEYQKTAPLFYLAIVDLNKFFITKGIKFADSENIKIYVNLEK
jgi:hypothetical protein